MEIKIGDLLAGFGWQVLCLDTLRIPTEEDREDHRFSSNWCIIDMGVLASILQRQVLIQMKRICQVLLACIIVFIFVPGASATEKLENYSQTTEAYQLAQISWQLNGLGRLSGDMAVTPNGDILLPLGSNMVCVDPDGNILWKSAAVSSSSLGTPIVSENGSVFNAVGSSVQAFKPNGNSAWNFSVYFGKMNVKTPLLAYGLDNRLYLPLSDAVYSLDLDGGCQWMLSSWDSSEAYMTKPDTSREILACTADKQDFYFVYGEKNTGYMLAAVSNQGKFLWTYWLGDITKADLLPGEDGTIFATVSLNTSSSSKDKSGKPLKTGKVYEFRINNGITPVWQQTVKTGGELNAPVYKEQNLYVTGSGRMIALNVSDGSVIWQEPIPDLVSAPSIDPQTGHIYAGGSNDYLFAVDQSGQLAWYRLLDSPISYPPLIGTDGYLYVFTDKGCLYKIKDSKQ
jgi:hypothetical protein